MGPLTPAQRVRYYVSMNREKDNLSEYISLKRALCAYCYRIHWFCRLNMANETPFDSTCFNCNMLPRHSFFAKLENQWHGCRGPLGNNKIKPSLMSTSSHLPNSPPPFSLPQPPPPPLPLTSSAGSGANLRVWAMPTYSLRRARFNTSKCCNASQLTLIIKACASLVLVPPCPPYSPHLLYTIHQGQGCEPVLLPAEKNTAAATAATQC